MLWIIFGIMLLAAALLAVWPLYRRQRRLSLISATIVVVVIGLSASLYSAIGTPNADSAAAGTQATVASVEDMVATLDARMQENPDDLAGWKMLGRSYMQLGNMPKAIGAFEAAVELEGSSNGETLISLGEALLSSDQTSLSGRAGRLFESGLALAPGDPRALFYGGLSAANRGANLLAADRWEAFLQQSPPAEIQDTLRQRIAQWRGEEAPASQTSQAVEPVAEANTVLSIDIRLDDSAAAGVSDAATVFVIARDPAQPSPPIAVVRRQVAALPLVVAINDSNAMVAGRVPSAYDELEILVRVSASGQPIAQSGDWFGQAVARPGDGKSVSINIDQQVP